MKSTTILGALALLLGTSCGPPVGPAPSAESFVAAPDLGFMHDNGFAGHYFFPETFGSGVALLDADQDGQLDLYAVQGGPVPGSAEAGATSTRPKNALFLGAGAGSFRDASLRSGAAADDGFGMGACVGDVDGDGRGDLFVTNVGTDRLLLATGQPDSLFREAPPSDVNAAELPNWSSSAGFADFDRDGHLDLVVLHYTRWSVADHKDCIGPAGIDYCDVNLYAGAEDHVYRGDGSGGFQDMSAAWSFGQAPGRALGLALVDFDDDGFVDIYVANDTDANHYYLNLGGAGFADKSALSGASANIDGRFEAGMGVAVADVSGDGLADLLVTNFTSEPNDLYVNLGQSRFRERARPAGIAAASVPKLAFGVTFADFDLDGNEDLFTACGHVQRHAEARSATWSWKQSDLLMLAEGGLRFRAVEPGELFATPRVGRGLAAGDLDDDGAIDLVVAHSGGPLLVGLNRLERRGSWLGVRLNQAASPVRSNTSAIGARLRLRLDDGQTLTRWVRSGTGYLSQDDQGQVFGIPTGRRATALEVRWPDGMLQTVEPGEPGRWLALRRD